jgi:putative ABC transport system permease protein
VLLRPLPYPESERLVGLWHTAPGVGVPLLPQAPGTYVLYQNAKSFESIGAYFDGESPIGHGSAPPVIERLPVAGVTASIFPTLRTRPLADRLFTETDELPGTQRVVVISERYWRTRLAATPSVIGTHITVDGLDREIVGVLPSTFAFPGSNIEIWAPIIIKPNGYLGLFGPRAIGRLRPGVTLDAAQRELQQILLRAPDTFAEQKPGLPTGPMLARTRAAAVVHPLRDDAIGGFAHILWIAATTIGVLVLVALSNLASLILARVESRQREFAVRSVLGASARRVWWSFLNEVLILAGIGGAIGLALGAAVLVVLPRTGATQLVDPRLADASRIVIPRLDEIHPGATLILSAIGITLLFLLAGATIGAGRLTTRDPGRTLREGGRAGTAGRTPQRLRAMFVAIEVALSLVLLSGSAMLGRSLQRLLRVDPGFNPAGAVTFWTSLRGTTYFDDLAIERFYHDAINRVARLPGVDIVGIVSKLPLENGPVLQLVTVEDAPPGSGAVGLPVAEAAASTDYFRAMGIPLVAGRSFDDANVRRGANEAVVGRSFAIRYWGDSTGTRALGRRIRAQASAPWYTVVGVVGDVRDTALTAAPMEVIYLPTTLAEGTTDIFRVRHDMAFVLRTTRSAASLAAELRREIHAVDPSVPLLELQALSEEVSKSGRRLRFVLVLLGVGATMTLALGVVGLYGVIAYLVNLRSREIGIRIALGLTPSSATRMIVREGETVVAIGAVAGVIVFVAFARLLRSLTYGVSAVDGASLAIAIVIVIGVASLATWLPARRAARIDPAEALRNE